MNVSGLAGFLLAKTAAAISRRKPKDWYDIAFVRLHNDTGGTAAPAASARGRFSGEIAAFQEAGAQGTRAYVTQMHMDHPEIDPETSAN